MNFTSDVCEICGMQNSAKLPEGFFSKDEIDLFIEHVFTGVITVYSLDGSQYLKMSRKMSESIVFGFGASLNDLNFGTDEYSLLNDLILSGYKFNAAKQYQVVREMSSLVNDILKTKQDYYIKANEIFKRYNIDYFEAELDSAQYQGASASDWLKIVKWNNEN